MELGNDNGGSSAASQGGALRRPDRRLEMAQVPTLRVSHLSPSERRAYLIADNAIAAKADWDRQVLAVELQTLIDIDFDVRLTGFDMGEIQIILDAGDQSRQNGDGAEKAVTKCSSPVVSQAGDQWVLGEHRLICGNAVDDRDFAAVDAAIQRWQSLTSQSAKLHGCGKVFEAVEQERRRVTDAEPARDRKAGRETA
jgi:hypothetical protein